MKMKQNRLCLLAVCTLLLSHKSGAVSFDPSLLAGASGESDLSRFSENNAMPAGSQEMDIYVNGSWKGRYTVIYGEQRDDIRIAERCPVAWHQHHVRACARHCARAGSAARSGSGR